MSAIYSLYKELLPPATIDACAEAHFISADAFNLVVSKGSVLQVYNVTEEDAPEGEDVGGVDDKVGWAAALNRVCVLPT